MNHRVNSVLERTRGRGTAWAAILIAAGLSVSPAQADFVSSPIIQLKVDNNRSVGAGAGNIPVAVSFVQIGESMLAEFSSGSGKRFTLQVKPGFQFDPTSNVTARSATFGINGGPVNGVATIAPSGAPNETLIFNVTSGGDPNRQEFIQVEGIRLLIITAQGAAGPAQTTLTLNTTALGGTFNNVNLVSATIIKGVPDHLRFANQPGNNQAGVSLLPTVAIVDFGGNIITNDDRTISVSIAANPGAATLMGNAVRNSSNGLATWVDADLLRINTAATGYTLNASHSGSPFNARDVEESLPFDISAGDAGHMVFSMQPATTVAGQPLLLSVSVFDNLSNPILTPLNITLDSAVNPGGWPLLTDSSLTKATSGGVATWNAADNLRINSKISGYRLSASGVGQPIQTDAFNIVAGPPALLRFAQQPTNVTVNQPVSPAVAVEIIDAFGNRTDSTATVTLALDTAPCGGALTGGEANADGGLATFSALALDTACDGDVLSATSPNLPGLTSDSFNVTAAPCGACGAGAAMAMAPMLLFQIGMRRKHRRWR